MFNFCKRLGVLLYVNKNARFASQIPRIRIQGVPKPLKRARVCNYSLPVGSALETESRIAGMIKTALRLHSSITTVLRSHDRQTSLLIPTELLVEIRWISGPLENIKRKRGDALPQTQRLAVHGTSEPGVLAWAVRPVTA